MEIAMENDISEQYEQSIDVFFFSNLLPPKLKHVFSMCLSLCSTSGHQWSPLKLVMIFITGLSTAK